MNVIIKKIIEFDNELGQCPTWEKVLIAIIAMAISFFYHSPELPVLVQAPIGLIGAVGFIGLIMVLLSLNIREDNENT